MTRRIPFGIVDPTLNAPCLDANGVPVFVGNPGVNDPSQCPTAATTNQILYPAPFVANANFNPLLGCYDLTRPTPSPNDGCPASTSGLYTFNGHTDVKELALYVQDSITKGNWALNLGLRGDFYNGLTTHREAEPRLGVAYNIKRTNTVLRVSYARTMETPFNENLVLSNAGMRQSRAKSASCSVTGSNITPFSPGWRNEFHAGLQQAFGKYLVFSGEYIWKYTHNAYDFSVLGATPITFPIEWDRSKIPGYAGRVSVPNLHGFTGAGGVLQRRCPLFHSPDRRGWGGSGRSGAVPHRSRRKVQPHRSHAIPAVEDRARGLALTGATTAAWWPARHLAREATAHNGPAGTDTVVDTSGLSADQQFEAGLFCGSVHPALPTPGNPTGIPLSSSLGTNLCPASQYGSSLLQIPAPEPKTTTTIRRVSRRATCLMLRWATTTCSKANVTNGVLRLPPSTSPTRLALYNFLSTFSGTHYVTPRALTAQTRIPLLTDVSPVGEGSRVEAYCPH